MVVTELADLRGPLPEQTTVLEASAGTGKTYTIAGLVTRYVAEGRAEIHQLLVVTFGRAATSELRSRVRERLQSAREALLDGKPSEDPVVEVLREGTALEVAARVRRLAVALSSFDAATVATTHEFCHQVLRALGILANHEAGTVLVDTLRDLVTEVADDLYLAFALKRGSLPFGRDVAQTIARYAIADPEAVLLPTGRDRDSEGDLRVRFGTAARREVEARKRAMKVLSFDDLLGRVRDALADPETGEQACALLRRRYDVVLVDEFQDTDPIQWDILHRAFHGHRTLVVIGDPKQAIYSFRGADVRAYLAAKQVTDHDRSLGTNWRSDRLVLDGLARLLRGAALGDPRITVTPVAPGHTAVAVGPAPDDAPVQIRVLTRDRIRVTNNGKIQTDAALEAISADVAAQIVDLLHAERTVTPRGGKPVPLAAGDIAVLVRTGKQAETVRAALSTRRVPCVLTGTASVFGSRGARDWALLLEALEQPHRSGRVRHFALSAFVGATAADLNADTGVALNDLLSQRLRGWAEVLRTRGVAGLFASVSNEQRLAERMLGHDDGERLLTDLRHVTEILHGQGISAELGLAGLVSWLRDRIDDAGGDADQERSRRLDTDRSAVQVVTVHTSKGLEFPVAMVPFGWHTSSGGSNERYPRGHDGDARTLFIGGKNDDDYSGACQGQDAEDAGEELRLLYVAMTRAISRLVLWWAPSWATAEAPLHRLLFAADAAAIPAKVDLLADGPSLQQLQTYAGGPVSVTTIDRWGPVRDAPPVVEVNAGDLDVASFDRGIDTDWRRTSYSGLSRDAHCSSAAVGSEADVAVKDDEPEVSKEAEVGSEGVVSLWTDLPGGACFGTVVHEVLEVADLSVQPLAEELLRVTGDPALVAALVPAVSTSLGPLASGMSLRDVPISDQLRELNFELPLAGGDAPVGTVRLREIAGLLRSHLPVGDPVRSYADALETGLMGQQVLRGYLAGSIDVVLRFQGRYLVVDHKTNRLAPRDVQLTAWHYRREALDTAMQDAHYPLQALLYCVAVHRFLRWRQPEYDPDVHLGGVLYLFLRGMCGPGVEGGVWSWKPPGALVVALSDLLAGVGRA